jgi:hypothetical protein
MAEKVDKKITAVREHSMHVPISNKNPTGITLRDRHLRRLNGAYLSLSEIEKIFENYDRKGLLYPQKKKMEQPSSDKYDDIIAVWCDYFNKKFNANPPLDPILLKPLLQVSLIF